MILVLGGTKDGREAAEQLSAAGMPVIYSSISAYNAPKENAHLKWHIGTMDRDALTVFMEEQNITTLVDGTHPYAKAASENAMAAAKDKKVRYIRLERPGITQMIADGEVEANDVIFCDSYEDAVSYLEAHPGNIMTTTGSRELARYQALDRSRVFPRVLPTSKVIALCESYGYLPEQIIAMQGPFSFDLNVALIKARDIRYLTTKDSGDIGGVAEKIKAAKACDVKVLCIARPHLDYPQVVTSADDVFELLKKK